MRLNYKKLGKYIKEINNRDIDLTVDKLLGVSIKKIFIPSIANIVGTDMSTYKIIKKNQFAYWPVTSRNWDKISIALLSEYEEAIVSQSYKVFEIIDINELLPEYLMMWFRRPEFDRYARFMSHGSTREVFDWDEMCDLELPVPDIIKQQEIVDEYNTIIDRISLNNSLITKLEETAQAIYRQWFVDFEFPDENGNPYKSKGGEMEFCEELEKDVPKGWKMIELWEIFNPRKWKNITRDDVVEWNIPVIAWWIEPSCYHNQSNTKSPVITISASWANAWFIKLHYNEVWSSDSSFIDQSITNYIYFYYVFLIINQWLIYSLQMGTWQPHIYPEHINSLKIFDIEKTIIEKYNNTVSPIFERIAFCKKENENLKKIKDLILSKMATETN